jgi:hypothetical protein
MCAVLLKRSDKFVVICLSMEVGIGIPQSDIPLALLAFNVGVELEQLAFIASALAVMEAMRRIGALHFVERRAATVMAYAIGLLAGFWFIECVAAFAT